MAYSTPLTAVSNATLTAAQWNASVRDNILETAPAKATTAGRIFVATGTNAIAERVISTAVVTTGESTSSTTPTDLTTSGPAVTATTGANALVFISCEINNNTSSAFSQAAYAVSSATTIAADITRGIELRAAAANQQVRMGIAHLETALTPGSNVFTMKYWASSGGGSGLFQNRRIIVMAL